MRLDLGADGREGALDPLVAPPGERRDIRREVDLARSHLARERRKLALGRAAAHDQVGAAPAQRAAQVRQALEHELRAGTRGVAAVHEPVVEAEDRDHPLGCRHRSPQRRVVVQPQVAAKPDEGGGRGYSLDAFVWDRPRPPRRPRRRDRGAFPSCPSSPPSGTPPTTSAEADVRPTSVIRTSRSSPIRRPAPATEITYESILPTAASSSYMCGSSSLTSSSSPSRKGSARSSISSLVPVSTSSNQSSGSPSLPSKWKCFPTSRSSSSSGRPASAPRSWDDTRGCTRTR